MWGQVTVSRSPPSKAHGLEPSDFSETLILSPFRPLTWEPEAGIPRFGEGVTLAEGFGTCLIGGYANTSMESRSR